MKILLFPKGNYAEIYFVMYIWTPKEVIDFDGHFSLRWCYCKRVDSRKANFDLHHFTKDSKLAILQSQWTNAVKGILIIWFLFYSFILPLSSFTYSSFLQFVLFFGEPVLVRFVLMLLYYDSLIQRNWDNLFYPVVLTLTFKR